jgi:hypothetical protein
MGSNRRYGDSISRQKDHARAEARALQPSTLPLELVTTGDGPITTTAKPQAVPEYLEVGVTLIRLTGHAIAWNSRHVQVRWTGTNPK